MINIFDIAYFYKIHDNFIIEDLIKNKKDVCINYNVNNSGTIKSRYIKTRPYMMMDIFSFNKSTKKFYALAIPLTTKKPSNYEERYWTKITFLDKVSYLMWDKMCVLNEKSMTNFYKVKGKKINISIAQKKFIYKDGCSRGFRVLKWEKYFTKIGEKY